MPAKTRLLTPLIIKAPNVTPAELKTIHHQFGLSDTAMAELLGVDPNTLRRWQRGERPIPKTIDILLYILEESPQARKLMGITLTD